MVSRRDFIKTGAIAGAASFVPMKGAMRSAFAYPASMKLRKFIQPLRRVGDVPIATPDAVAQPWWQPGVTHYTIDCSQFEDQLHPDLPNPTRLWGYGQGANFKHIGGIIATKRDVPVQITMRNNLPPTHILPVDRTIMGASGVGAEGGDNRIATHLHGGYVPWISDGGPHHWWDPNGLTGSSLTTLGNPIQNPAAAPNAQEIYYPNQQSSRLMWYHDHAFGITRLNAYAGIATGYVVYDDYELAMTGAPFNLPGPLDPRTHYLVFQDKHFVSPTTAQSDPTWYNIMPNSRPGDLWYPHVYDPTLWEQAPGFPTPPDPSIFPEHFGDTMLVNGTVYPYLDVEPRQYRFRLLNACNARFLNLRLVHAKGRTGVFATEPSTRLTPGPGFLQIGNECGFLPAPTMISGPGQKQLLLSPAERADLIVDFRNVAPGSVLILYNDGEGPFTDGVANQGNNYDYYPGNPNTPASIPGYGPNSRTIMQIRVKPRVGPADPVISLPPVFTPTDPFMLTQTPGVPTPVPAGVPVRRFTLVEGFDGYGRLIQMLGGDTPDINGEFGVPYESVLPAPIAAGSTEVWEVLNLTMDTHPIHLHLVNFHVLSRQDFDAMGYVGGAPLLTGPEIAPDNNELGWKETVRMNPSQVTRIIATFSLPTVPFVVPPSPRTGGNEYVWHCHILEHEEHDMMNALVVA